MENRKTILVTAIGSFSAEAVIRISRNIGYRVLGCDIYPAEWLAASEEVDAFFRAPLAADTEAYLAFLGRICREEKVDYLVPLTDAEIDVINGWRREAEALGVTVCLSPEESIRLCRDKWAAAKRLSEAGVCRTIPTRRLSEVTAAEAADGYRRLVYPAVLKPIRGRSSQGLLTVTDATQMRLEAERLSAVADSYLVQPKIEGYVVTVDVVRKAPEESAAGDTAVWRGDAAGGNPDASAGSGRTVCLPRREYLRTGNGAGLSVCVFRDERLEAQCAAIARTLDVVGCVNFEFVEERPGNWYFLECNPRFSGGVAFSCMAGYDMVANHLRCFTGEPVEAMREVRPQYLVKRYTEYRTKLM